MRTIAATVLALAVLAGCSSGPRTVYAPTEIPWARAAELVLAGEVVELEARKDGSVRLHLTDGRHLVAQEPSEGEARRLVERCGATCAKTKVR